MLNYGKGMPIRRVIDLSIQMCRGLAAAHRKGIVHRDLKPENVFIVNPDRESVILGMVGGERKDLVKVLDFGIARFTYDERTRITQLGSVFGTPQYMSPSKLRGKIVTFAATFTRSVALFTKWLQEKCHLIPIHLWER